MPVTSNLVTRYSQLFCNRLAYTLQSFKADEETGRHNFFLATWRSTGEALHLSAETIRRHLEGKITIGLFAVNPKYATCKWVAMDADYDNALPDLRRVRTALSGAGIDSGLELSRRGGHLWVFMESPALARECRIYFLNLALELGIPIKGPTPKKSEPDRMENVADGIEVFPKQDEIEPGGFGNGVRGPLGIHRAVPDKRFWFEGARPDITEQMRYIESIQKFSEAQLKRLIEGKSLPEQFERKVLSTLPARQDWRSGSVFQILDHVATRRKGKEYVAQCPSCAQAGRDRHRDNLHISVANPLMYMCRAGCTPEMIRQALGRPKRLSA